MYSHTKKIILLLICSVSFFAEAQLFQNGQAASFAIGASGPGVAGTLGTSAQKMTSPVAQSCYVIDAKHGCVWVADYFGNRVLRFSYPITSNQPTANLVLGQTNFSSCNYGGLTAASLGNPQGLAVDSVTGNLYVLCISQNRVLRFNNAHLIASNGAFANAVFGQIHYGNSTAGTSQTQFSFNQAPACGNLLHYDQLTGALWVSDNNNARVLRFDNANNLSIGASASAVLGQTGYTSNTTALSANKFTRPDGLMTIGTSLFVSDPVNNRILRFDNVYAKANGAAADAVFGQNSFSTAINGTAANLLNAPTGLSGNQSHLIVSDAGNNRVLIFSNPLVTTSASAVLLASTFTNAGSGGASATTAAANYNIAYDGLQGQLFVQDRQNSRILVFQSCPSIQITGPTSICSGSTITLSALGVTNFTWNTNQTSATITITPIATANYSVTGFYTAPTHTCYTTCVKTISVETAPLVTLNSGSICAGQNFTLNAGGANTYTYSSSIVVSPSVTTSYSVIGKAVSGCTSSALATISVAPLPQVSVQSGSICSSQSFTISPSGAATYTIEGGAAIVSPTCNTSYSVLGMSSNGCLSNVAAICNVSVIASPSISVANGSVCAGQSYTLSPSGATSYNIVGGSFVVMPAFTSTYAITGSNAQGCSSSNAVVTTVSVFPRPTISIFSGTICAGQSFTLTPSGAATYTFEGGSAIVSPSVSTSYTARGYSAEGCLSLNTVKCKITVNPTPLVTFNIVPNRMCLNEGPVQVQVSPPGGNCQGYSISNGTFMPTYVGNLTLSYAFTDPTTGCSAGDTASLKVEACTDLSENNNASSITLFPNPTRNSITVNGNGNEISQIMVMDVSGRLLFTKITMANTESIDLSNYCNGIYFIQLSLNNTIKTIKVVKE